MLSSMHLLVMCIASDKNIQCVVFLCRLLSYVSKGQSCISCLLTNVAKRQSSISSVLSNFASV